MTTLSVISTVYNGGAYSDRAIPGILGQTLDDFEWIIVDDGSTDETPDLLLRLAAADRRVRVLSPGRLGRSQALNLAVEHASGPYIAQQDFDDVSFPERIDLQRRFLDDHPEVGLVGGYYHLIDEIRGERFVRCPPTDHAAILRAMAKSIPFAHTVVTYRKQAWRDAGGYPEAEAMIDFRMFIEMAHAGWQLANLGVVIGEHYISPKAFWRRSGRYERGQHQMRQLQLRAIRKLGLPRWMEVYPLGRLFYQYLPHGGKRFLRRHVAGSAEEDLLAATPRGDPDC